jgi:multidrug resistance efflux pump
MGGCDVSGAHGTFEKVLAFPAFFRGSFHSNHCSTRIYIFPMISKIFSYVITLLFVVAACYAGWVLYKRYQTNPWTRDCQVKANVVGIAPRVSGPITRVNVIDNATVKKGDLLFEIDPADYKAALDVADAQVETAQAELTQREQDMRRQTDLYTRHVSAQQDYQNAQNNLQAAEAGLNSAKANQQASQLRLSYTQVYASVDGYVTNMNVSIGTYVNAGGQLMALVDTNSFWIAAYFKETQLPQIHTDQRAKISILGYEHQTFEGIVESIGWGIFVSDGAASTTTDLLPSVSQTVDWVRLPQRFPVRLRLAGKPPVELRIGQTVSASMRPYIPVESQHPVQ